MTPSEKRVLLHFLADYRNSLEHRGCNDLELAELMPDKAERVALIKYAHEQNGDPQEFDPKHAAGPIQTDFFVLFALVRKLKAEWGMS